MLAAGAEWAAVSFAKAGGASGLCYEFCKVRVSSTCLRSAAAHALVAPQMVLQNFTLAEMAPSPLKEALLRLISKLLSKINELRTQKYGTSHCVHVDCY